MQVFLDVLSKKYGIFGTIQTCFYIVLDSLEVYTANKKNIFLTVFGQKMKNRPNTPKIDFFENENWPFSDFLYSNIYPLIDIFSRKSGIFRAYKGVLQSIRTIRGRETAIPTFGILITFEIFDHFWKLLIKNGRITKDKT